MTKIALPKPGWWRELSLDEFVDENARWTEILRENLANISFDHQLFLPDGNSGGHQNESGVFYCGEAAFVEEFKFGMIFAFFWTGEKISENAYYAYIPRELLIFDKETGKEAEISLQRRTRTH